MTFDDSARRYAARIAQRAQAGAVAAAAAATSTTVSGAGAGAAGQVAYWLNGLAVAGDAALTYDASTNVLSVDSIQWDITPTANATAEGLMRWNVDDKTLEVGLAGGTVALQLGQELLLRVKNDSGGALSNGAVVYVSGGSGATPQVKKAKANAELTSAVTLGIMTEAVTNSGYGYMTIAGLVRDVNTNAHAAGTILYLSPSTAGEWTATKPVGPNHVVTVAVVIRQHATEGVVLATIQNGYELGELHDVTLSTSPAPAAGQSLIYNGSVWANGAVDLADGDARTGVLPVANGGTGLGSNVYCHITKGGTDQTGIADSNYTKISWSAPAVADANSIFNDADDSVTPPAGLYLMQVNILWLYTTVVGSREYQLWLIDDGLLISNITSNVAVATGQNNALNYLFLVRCDGVSAYSIYARHTAGSSQTIYGSALSTFWKITRLSA